MSSLSTAVLGFVKAHDSNPKNNTAERIPEEKINQSLAEEFSTKVLQGKDTPSFHAANEILFEFIPPSKRDQFLKWLSDSCNKRESAFCKQGETYITSRLRGSSKHSDGFEQLSQRESDLRTSVALEQIKDLDKIPAISKTDTPEIYQKLTWLIQHAKKRGEEEFANTLETALTKGNLKYLPDLKIASAYADPRKLGVIVFGKNFFERTWANEIQGLDGKPIEITDDMVVRNVNETMNIGEAEDSPMRVRYHNLEEIEHKPPYLKPEKIRAELKLATLEQQKKRYTLYFGSLPIQTFPRNMPSWIILVAHEIRHTMQLGQDKSDWNPEWANGKGIKGFAYYTTLVRFRSSQTRNDPASALLGGSAFLLGKEARVRKSVEGLASVREREATVYGVAIAKKLVKDWAQEQVELNHRK